jgi:hypothetical protein
VEEQIRTGISVAAVRAVHRGIGVRESDTEREEAERVLRRGARVWQETESGKEEEI